MFPPGIPGPIYILLTPIEFVSTFILRPITLFIRLLANMIAGHLILVPVLQRVDVPVPGLPGRALVDRVLRARIRSSAAIVFTFFEGFASCCRPTSSPC